MKSPPDSSGAGGPDAGDPDGDGGCALALEEAFDGLDPEVWDAYPDQGGSIGAAGGKLTLQVSPVDGDGSAYVEVTSIGEWDLTGLTITADLAVSWGGAGNGDAALIVDGWTTYLGVIADSSIIAVTDDEGYLCDPEPCDTDYSAEGQRYWRIREADGELHFETSGDASLWNPVGPPQETPPGEHVITFWSECDEGNETTMVVDRLTVECGA